MQDRQENIYCDVQSLLIKCLDDDDTIEALSEAITSYIIELDETFSVCNRYEDDYGYWDDDYYE